MLKRQSSLKGDGYVPAVPSPLNPTVCDRTQSKPKSQHRRRIRVAGKTGSKQSPTEILLRYKAAVAFQDHSAAIERTRELEARRLLDSECSAAGDLGVRSTHSDCASESGKTASIQLAASRKHRGRSRSGDRSSAEYSQVSRDLDVTDLVLRVVATGPMCRDPGTNLLKGETKTTCTTTSVTIISPTTKTPKAVFDGGKAEPDVASEFLVDFSGVTIDTLTTAVFAEQRRTFLAWATPGRMLWPLTLISVLLLLVFIRLQALSARYLAP